VKTNHRSTSAARVLVLSIATALGACSAEGELIADLEPVEADDISGVAETGDEITATYPAGTAARTNASLNLRSSASTRGRVITVMPSGSRVTLVTGRPQGGWYQVTFNGDSGWAFGNYLVASGSTGGTPPPSGPTTDPGTADFTGQRARALASRRFSYWWGFAKLDMRGPDVVGAGSCSGSCPSCSHSGSYGADCSGFVSKVWQVPSWNAMDRYTGNQYTTDSFRNTTGSGAWSQISRGSARPGDALVYRSGGRGHIVWIMSGDPFGSPEVIEARGCSFGIVHNNRSFGSEYVGVRRR
jgi:hypothetical protein